MKQASILVVMMALALYVLAKPVLAGDSEAAKRCRWSGVSF